MTIQVVAQYIQEVLGLYLRPQTLHPDQGFHSFPLSLLALTFICPMFIHVNTSKTHPLAFILLIEATGILLIKRIT